MNIPNVPLHVGRLCRLKIFRSRLSLPAATLFFPLWLVLTLLSSGPLYGQNWQMIYGGDEEQAGCKRVRPLTGSCVTNDAEQGYIAVGWSTEPGQDVYVVRIDNHGIPLWEYTYDINSGSDDYGQSIIEMSDGTGFVVTGYTISNNNTDLFLMKIDCDGQFVWTKTYGTSSDHEFGYDLIEDPSSLYNIIVVGEKKGVSSSDAYILRTDNVGAVYWDNAVHYSTFDAFRALTLVSGGDIMAVGYSSGLFTAKDGLAVRLDGTTGGIVSSAVFGADNHEDFHSVIELQNPGELGPLGFPNVVIAGWSRSYSGNFDIYLVKLADGDPCDPIKQVIHHTPTTVNEAAYDIQEITFVPNGGSFNQWELALTGYCDETQTREMILRTVDPGNLNPAGVNMSFGQNGTEEGWSLFPIEGSALTGRTTGFILCGISTTDWYNTNDPADIYMIKTDGTGSSGDPCESPFNAISDEVNFPYDCLNLNDNPPLLTPTSLTHSEVLQDWEDPACPQGKRVPLFETEFASSITVQPNPVPSGADVILVLPDIDELDATGTTSVHLVNELGQTIPAPVTGITPSTGEIRIDTRELRSGTYRISVLTDNRKWEGEVVILR